MTELNDTKELVAGQHTAGIYAHACCTEEGIAVVANRDEAMSTLTVTFGPWPAMKERKSDAGIKQVVFCLQPCALVCNKTVFVGGVGFHDLVQSVLRRHGAIVRHTLEVVWSDDWVIHSFVMDCFEVSSILLKEAGPKDSYVY